MHAPSTRRPSIRGLRLAALGLGAALTAIPAFAAPATSAPSAKAPALTAEAKQALEEMSSYLRQLKSFELTADGTAEAVTDEGQSIEFGLQLHYLVQTPDRLMGEVSTGARKVQLFYDGASLTVAVPGEKYYAQAPITGSLSTLLARADAQYGVTLPLESLFRWGDATRPQEWPTSGFKVGTAKCGAAICTQYAFRQAGYDWQMWLRQGSSPLPVRLVFIGKDRTSRPRTTATLTWVTGQEIAAERFRFVPPATASRVALAPAAIAPSKGTK